MGNAGEARLDVVAMGRDEVSVVMNKVSGELDALKAKVAGYERTMKASGKAVSENAGLMDQFAKKIGDVKTGASGLNKVREGFENLRSNAFFLTSAVTGVVGAVVAAVGAVIDFAKSNDEAAIAAKRWAEEAKRTESAIDRAYDALYKFKYTEVEAAWADINKQLKLAEQTAAKLKDDYELQRPVLDDINRLRSVQAGLESRIARDLERQRAALDKIAERSARLNAEAAADNLGYPTDPFADNEEARKRRLAEAIKRNQPVRGGDGGKRLRDQRGDFFGQRTRSSRWDVDPEVAANAKAIRDDLIGEEFGGRGDGEGGGSALQRVASDFDKLTAAVSRFSEQMTPVLDEVFPGLGSAVSGVDAIMQAFAETTEKTAEAQVKAALTGSTAVLGGIGRILGGRKGEWTAMSIAEAAAAAASIAIGDGFGFAQHTAASIGYAAAASKVGGSGGAGARAGGSGGGFGGGGGGPSTVVWNVSTLVADPYTLERAQSSSDRSTRGTGVGSMAGA